MVEILVGLLFVLGIITVVGHAIWWLLATIFRALFGSSPDPEIQQISLSKECVECGASLKLRDDFCQSCGRSQKATTKPDPLADLATTARQMDRFLNLGKIDLATHKSVMEAIAEERERLTQPMRPQQPVKSVIETPQPQKPAPVIEPVPIAVEPIAPVVFTPKPNKPKPKEVAKQSEPEPVYSQPESPREPRRSFAELLETFMEESSIRWGEIVGGLLIIGCSLALVISLWSQITAVPLLKFSVFVGVTAGLFGIGFYSAHRWKLPTTSRGALTISILLVPLNFLAMTAFSQTSTPNLPIVMGGELVALVLFLFLVYQAAKVIAPGNSWLPNSWLMAGATLLPCFSMLMAKHWQSNRAAVVLLGVAPLAFYWLTTGAMLKGAKEEPRESSANRTFLMLGIASFAALLPFGLLLFKSGIFRTTMHSYAAFITLFGVPAIACGLTLRADTEASGKTKTAATSIALIGTMLAIGGLALSWPWPLQMIGIALINCAVCGVIAWRFDLKLAHVAAIAFFVLAVLFGSSVLVGNIPSWSEDGVRLIACLWTRATGLAWMTLFVLFGIAAELWRRVGRKTESHIYEFATVASAFFSLLILTWHGFGRAGDPQYLALTFLFYAVAAFVIAWHRNQFIASWIGLSLSLLTILQAFAFKFGYQLAPHHPVRLSLLTFASLATVAAIALRKQGEKALKIFVKPATTAALVGSIAVAPFVLFGGWMTLEQLTIRVLWLAAIWLALSVVNCWPVLFTAFQAALTVGVVCGVAAIFDGRVLPSHLSWSDPLRLQAQGIALALLSLGWIVARLKARQANGEQATTRFQKLLFPPWPTVDQIVVVMVWLLLIVLSFSGIGDLLTGRWLTGSPISAFSDFANRVHSLGSWLLLLSLALVFFVSLWERFKRRLPLALMTLLACACLLLAGRWAADGSTVQPLRSLAAISFALVALLIIFRNSLRRFCERFNWPQMSEASAGLASLARAESLALFAAPVLALTAGLFLTRAPEQVSLAAKLIFLAPLFIVSLTLAAFAVRERSAIYAFTSGLMLNLAATLGCLFNGDVRLITVLQINVITSAVVSLVWLQVRSWLAKRPEVFLPEGFLDEVKRPVGHLLQSQIVVTLLVSLSLLLFADMQIIMDPASSGGTAATIGNGWGWLATMLSAAAWLNLRRQRLGGWFEKLSSDYVGVALLAAASLIVCGLSRAVDGWASYHALMIGVGASAWLIFAVRSFGFSRLKIEGADTAVGWATCLGVVQFVMTMRGIEAPNSIWWTVASLSVLSLLFGWMAIATRHRGYVYLSAPLLNLIASLLFDRHFDVLDNLFQFLAVNIIVLSLGSLIWLWLEMKLMEPTIGRHPFHRRVIVLLLPAIFFLTGFHWLIRLVSTDHVVNVWLNWVAVLSVAALLTGYLWDNRVYNSLRGLHFLGGMVVLEICCMIPLIDYSLLAITVASLSFYALATSWLWARREALTRMVEGSSISVNIGTADLMRSWLAGSGVFMVAFVLLSNFGIVFNAKSLGMRLLAATAAFAVPAAFSLLVRGEQDQRQDHRLITGSIRLFFVNAVFWSWAWLSPVYSGAGWQAINRLVIVMLIAEAVLIAYRLIVMRRVTGESLWRKALRADLPILALIGLISLAFVMVVEIEQFSSFGIVLIGWPAIVAVLVTLVGVSLIGIAFAILPGEDPFDLDERGRMRYVYLSEVFLVLTFLHLRLTMPWMFGGFFARFWPIAVMLLAFAGAGLSEFFRRQGRMVLAEPLGRTGVLLPLLPVIGFWSLNSEVPYSGLLLLVGLFYGVLSVMRRSFAFGILAALAGNAGLWHLLKGVDGLAFYEHPQLWLIPAALSVLLAARINRESLTVDQMNSIRYGALVTIYVSSTADIFLNGVDDSPWLPIILAVLAVGGVVAGLMIRIRAFLFLGTSFLLLSMLTMIWSASVNLHWTWLWYVTGIGFGILIIYTVAMFERKREQMLGFVERLKQWQ